MFPVISFKELGVLFFRVAKISAKIERAISSGVCAQRFKPAGVKIRSKKSSDISALYSKS